MPCSFPNSNKHKAPALSKVLANLRSEVRNHFTLFFNAAKAKAFTTFLAGLALTFTNSPNAIRLPAFVAGLYLFLIMQTPGMVNLPVPFTSCQRDLPRHPRPS